MGAGVAISDTASKQPRSALDLLGVHYEESHHAKRGTKQRRTHDKQHRFHEHNATPQHPLVQSPSERSGTVCSQRAGSLASYLHVVNRIRIMRYAVFDLFFIRKSPLSNKESS